MIAFIFKIVINKIFHQAQKKEEKGRWGVHYRGNEAGSTSSQNYIQFVKCTIFPDIYPHHSNLFCVFTEPKCHCFLHYNEQL